MSKFKEYRRIQIAEMRELTYEELSSSATALRSKGISVAPIDIENGSPRKGDMIARNINNHKDQWLVAEQYFKDNFEEL